MSKKFFKKISDINIDTSFDESNAYITLDIDWAHDYVIEDTVNIIERANIQATWFVTHDTPILKRIAENPNFELGIHPNFNYLLEGSSRNGSNSKEVIERLMSIVPSAKSIRSHSLTQSTRLIDLFQSFGLMHEVNQFIPFHAGIKLKPWKTWNGIYRVPYCWEDDIHLLYTSHNDINQLDPSDILISNNGGLKIFNFHPIHVFLNTEKLDRYENTRELQNNPQKLILNRYVGHGTRSRLISLLEI